MRILTTRKVLTGLISVIGCYISHIFTYIVINKSRGFSGDSIITIAIRESKHCYITPQSLMIPILGALILMYLSDKKSIQKIMNYKSVLLYQGFIFYTMELFRYSIEDYHHAPTLKEIYVGILIQIPVAILLTFLAKVAYKLIGKLKALISREKAVKLISCSISVNKYFIDLILVFLSKLLRSPPIRLV